MSDSDGKKMADSGSVSLDRREFLTAGGAVLASLGAWEGVGRARPMPLPESSPEGVEDVETPICRLRLDRRNGNLAGIAWKNPALEIIREPRLGEEFPPAAAAA